MITNIFLAFLEISISISLIIALLLLLTPFLNKRYAAKWKYWIWIVLALRLLIPLGGNGGEYVADMRPQGETPASSESGKTSLDTLADGTALRRVVVEIPAQMTAPIVMQPEKAGSDISMLDMIALVWVFGSLLFISVHLISYFHFNRQIHKLGRVVEDRDVLGMLFKLKRELHVSCKVTVIEYPKAVSPMITGFLGHILVLPEGQCNMEAEPSMGEEYSIGEEYSMGKGYSQEDLFFILKHELVHLKRGDIGLKLLFVAANAVHWFNPLIWILQKEAAVDMELSCDERVIQGTDYATRKAYTETLLSTLHKQSAKKTVLSTEFYGGKRIMKKRFLNILAKTGKKNGIAMLICAIILTVSLGTLVGCSVTKENTEDGSGLLGTNDSETEPPISNYPAETMPPSANNDTQDAENYDADREYFYLTWNPLLLSYYNTYEGHTALYNDFADLASEGMLVQLYIIEDDHLVVTVRYEDNTLLTEGIEETLAQQLDSMTNRIEEQMNLYNTEIIGPASVRVIDVQYVDMDGNVLAVKNWSGQ